MTVLANQDRIVGCPPPGNDTCVRTVHAPPQLELSIRRMAQAKLKIFPRAAPSLRLDRVPIMLIGLLDLLGRLGLLGRLLLSLVQPRVVAGIIPR